MSPPKVIFGAALLGMSFDDAETTSRVLDSLMEAGVTHIDTAARYPPLNQGQSERLLGETHAASRGFDIDSKILMSHGASGGELEASAIIGSLENSLGRLGSKSLDTLYCHRYDPTTPLIEQAATFHKLHQQGLFKQLGVCRYEPDQLEAFLRVCDENNYIKPTVYQGEYNVLTRGMETRLLPLLRAHNMVYHAHKSLATGFLTANFTNGAYHGTRFADEHPLHGAFRAEYDHACLHAAVKKMEELGQTYGIVAREVALRWLFYHSVLGERDAVIIGCTKMGQIKENAASIAQGPLPKEMVEAVEELWVAVKGRRGMVL